MPPSVPRFDELPVDLKAFWAQIDLVMLDMDGTLLDRHFDDYFWEHFVPEEYARNNQLSPDEAKQSLRKRYQAREGTLAWTDLDFWSDELGLDIPTLKMQVEHLIAIHPYVVFFLEYCRELGKTLWLVTNAHSKTLNIKMAKTALQDHFDRLICAEEVGVAKEDPGFWWRLQELHDYNPERTLLVDDTEKVLCSAVRGGIRNLIYVGRPSSQAAVKHSQQFASITYFKELIPDFGAAK
jgi:HAD superfamily hydrolase (TIGR01509 family)